ncbi:hypothetical protein GCM10011352_35210 [Marinobacterium zhoushanense]|uniref:Rieske domain-containing protein n=1 Tax=Marinobacterium zhoushanense TaxID=1679163 RepID=A0ABQ1KPG7_9GAMM|nr:non-heme iron oxygenase ferredoxin subunit [Marinobacterium zhoushanense]GGC05957.1 hypothetical protein GCM10011352_35210 [Marinobacterium zhoushanense]
MDGWQDIGDANLLAPGEHQVVELPGYSVLVVNLQGEYYAVENICPHDGGELGEGLIEQDTVTCPRHGACFSLKNGEVLAPPAFEDLRCFQVRLDAGRLLLAEQPEEGWG